MILWLKIIMIHSFRGWRNKFFNGRKQRDGKGAINNEKRSNKFSLLTKLGGGGRGNSGVDSAHSIIPFSGSKSKASVERLSNTYNRRACSKAWHNTCTRTHSDLRKRVFIHATREWNEKPWADVHGLPKCAYTDSLSLSVSLFPPLLSVCLLFHEWIYTRYIASFSPPVRISTLVTVALFISILFRLYIPYTHCSSFWNVWFWLSFKKSQHSFNTLLIKFRRFDLLFIYNGLSIDEISFDNNVS